MQKIREIRQYRRMKVEPKPLSKSYLATLMVWDMWLVVGQEKKGTKLTEEMVNWQETGNNILMY